MPTRLRLDAELVRRGLATTRSEARRLIADGAVDLSGFRAPKAATMVDENSPIRLAPGRTWASRAGGKLEAAIDSFEVEVEARRVLDVGASTGGFTDVLLARGAARVVAVDVGRDQMVRRLRSDSRVTVVDGTNFRTADVQALGAPFDLITADVSFISLTLLASNLAAAGREGTDYVVLVKPQFEVGPKRLRRGGLVRDPELHAEAVGAVARSFATAGLAPRGVIASPVVGAGGNLEFLLHAIRGGEDRHLEWPPVSS